MTTSIHKNVNRLEVQLYSELFTPKRGQPPEERVSLRILVNGVAHFWARGVKELLVNGQGRPVELVPASDLPRQWELPKLAYKPLTSRGRRT